MGSGLRYCIIVMNGGSRVLKYNFFFSLVSELSSDSKLSSEFKFDKTINLIYYLNNIRRGNVMLKTIEAYYENGKIIYKDSMPSVKNAKLLITILEEVTHKTKDLSRFKGIFKKKIDGLKYQKKLRKEWD